MVGGIWLELESFINFYLFFDLRMVPKDPLETMSDSEKLLTRKDQRELRRGKGKGKGKGKGRGRGRGRGKKEPREDMLPPSQGEGESGVAGEGESDVAGENGSGGAGGKEHTDPPNPPQAAPEPAPKRKSRAKAKAKAKAKASPSSGSAPSIRKAKAKAKAGAKAKSQPRKRVAGEGGDQPEVEGIDPRPKRKPRQVKCDVPDPVPEENRNEFKKFHI